MDDLISRKTVMDEIKSLTISIAGLRAGKGVLAKFEEEYRKSILRIIDEAPTAYDVEAVLNQLNDVLCDEISQPVADDVVNIIRGGGVDGWD